MNRMFRVVEVRRFLDYFASDRSHMISSGKPFPTWPSVKGPRATSDMNLFDYIDMSRTGPEDMGQVFSLPKLLNWLES